MRLSRQTYRGLTWSLMVLAFGMTFYRATTQPIGHDEALAWEWYLDGGIYHLLAFDTNNHVLFTIPAKLFIKLFNVREITLRMPSVLGALAYLILTYVLARRLFGDGILLPLSVAMLSLNPLILDFMAAARGYILGLACLAAAMCAMTRAVERVHFGPEDREWRSGCITASVFLALSVAANLSNVFPAAGLTLAFAAAALFGSSTLQLPDKRNLKSLVQYLIVPGATVGLFIMWPYLLQMRPAQFNISLPRASDALRDTFASSFLYKWTDDIYSSSLGAVAPRPGSWQDKVLDLGTSFLLPLVFCFLVLGLFLVYGCYEEKRRNQRAHCRVFAGAPVACALLAVILHVLFKVNYPFSRYCIYLIPLTTAGAMLVAGEIAQRVPNRILKAIGLLIAGAVVADYLLSLNTKYFRYNAYDVISRRLFLTIAIDAENRSLRNVRVGGTWWYEPELNFYRRRYHAEWMMPYDVKDRSYFWESPNSLEPADYNYFVFTPASDPRLEGTKVRIVFRDTPTGLIVIGIDK